MEHIVEMCVTKEALDHKRCQIIYITRFNIFHTLSHIFIVFSTSSSCNRNLLGFLFEIIQVIENCLFWCQTQTNLVIPINLSVEFGYLATGVFKFNRTYCQFYVLYLFHSMYTRGSPTALVNGSRDTIVQLCLELKRNSWVTIQYKDRLPKFGISIIKIRCYGKPVRLLLICKASSICQIGDHFSISTKFICKSRCDWVIKR